MKKGMIIIFASLLLGNSAIGQIISTVAGTGAFGFGGDGGPATAAQMRGPSGLALDAGGNLYFTDGTNCRVRKITPSGTISTFAGNGFLSGLGATGDGGQATAAYVSNPECVTADASGNIYITDGHRLRMVNTSGIISTIAGTGSAGYSGDGGPATAAKLSFPNSIAIDNSGNIFIADANNARIRKINTSGVISTFAGTGSYTGHPGDGGAATAAEFSIPKGLVFDAAGNLYVTDADLGVVRKINTSGIISTIAGDGSRGYSGDGGQATAAELFEPSSITIDNSGNLYIADITNQNVRKIATSGIISTFAGNGTAGYSGDGGPASAAEVDFSNGTGVAADASGRVYFSDGGNNRIRKVTAGGVTNHVPTFATGSIVNVNTCANSGGVPLNEQLKIRDADAGQTLVVSVVSGPGHGTANVSYSTTSTGSIFLPAGRSYTPTTGYTGADSIVVRVSDGQDSNNLVLRITINASPAVPVITGATSLCFHGTTTLSATPTGGTWLAYDGNASVSSGGVVTSIGGGASHIGYLSPADAHGCKSTTLYTVTPIGTPSAGSLTGTGTVCPGSSVTYMPSVPGGSWTSSNPSVATVTGGGSITGVVTGNAMITYTINNGCFSASTNKTITVTGATNPGPIGGMPNINMPSTVTFVNSLAGGTWSSINTSVAVITSGGVISGVAAGADTIIYTYTNGCGISASVMKRITVLSHRGNINVEELGAMDEGAVHLIIYPNPTTGFATLDLPGTTGKTDVVVFDLTGRVVNTSESETAKMMLDFNDLSSGTYFIKVSNGGKVYTEKVIVQ